MDDHEGLDLSEKNKQDIREIIEYYTVEQELLILTRYQKIGKLSLVLKRKSGRFKFSGAANSKVEVLSLPSSIPDSQSSWKFSWNFFLLGSLALFSSPFFFFPLR